MSATLFFDLDNTLCRPRAPFLPIFLESCAPLLASPLVDDQTLLRAWGEALEAPGRSTTAGCLARALAACGAPAEEQVVTSCASTLAANWAAAQELAPAAKSTLANLAGRYPLGIITNGPSDAQHAVIAALHLERFFRWRIVSGDPTVGIRKPQRGIFDLACDLSASQPERTWYIGDSLVNDIAGAAGAGWRTCWITATDEHLAAGLPAPDARITRLDELPRIIGQYK
ncbi:MAG TPA: HAD family hydrolase [Ktedonobacterales bacterium]|nr:HAD family hydrolase [Ktedonobacterales bacterium]